MARSDPTDPGLPLKLEPCSNGEYIPSPASNIVKRTIAETNRIADSRSRRLGLSRRDFLRSSAGMTTMMAVLAACSAEEGQTGGQFDPTTSTSTSSSTTTSPPASSTSTTEAVAETEETMDDDAAEEALAAPEGEFIFDIQGHLLEYPDDAPGNPGFPQSNCGEAIPGDCYGIDHFFEAIFVDSETTMVMLSAIPFGNGALSNTVMQQAVDTAGRFGCSDRVLMQGESFPTSVGIDAMEAVAADFNINAFKTYTHNGGPEWRLDDATGNAYFEKVQEVGVPIVAVHKGLSGNNPASSPVDVGPAAVNHPDVDILVYHSGYENSSTEGPYSADADVGVNRHRTTARRTRDQLPPDDQPHLPRARLADLSTRLRANLRPNFAQRRSSSAATATGSNPSGKPLEVAMKKSPVYLHPPDSQRYCSPLYDDRRDLVPTTFPAPASRRRIGPCHLQLEQSSRSTHSRSHLRRAMRSLSDSPLACRASMGSRASRDSNCYGPPATPRPDGLSTPAGKIKRPTRHGETAIAPPKRTQHPRAKRPNRRSAWVQPCSNSKSK